MTGDLSQLGSPYTPRAELIEMFGDAVFVDDLAAQFRAQCLVALDDMHSALAAADARGISKAAHALKGTVGYFDPGAGQAMVEGIERITSAELPRVPALLGALELRMGDLRQHLSADFQ